MSKSKIITLTALITLGFGVVGIANSADVDKIRAENEAAMKAEQVFVDLGGGVQIELILIPSGFFRERYIDGTKKPERLVDRMVKVQSFYLSKYETTQEQWEALMGRRPSTYDGPKYPVRGMTWEECRSFLSKLNQRTGKTFAFPTPEEWRHACLAGRTNKHGYAGDAEKQKLRDYAWYHSNSGDKVRPVGQKKPNAWGLYDMCGNVSELTKRRGQSRGFRMYGGSYSQAALDSSCAGYNVPTYQCENYGFRLRLPRLWYMDENM